MHPIGFSTGALALGNFRQALGSLYGKPYAAVELSALRVSELPLLMQAIHALDLRQFSYVAVHAPSSFGRAEEEGVVQLLSELPKHRKIILHPDTIHDPLKWVGFGDQLAIENMDRRKRDGRSAEELTRWFSLLPEARLCLDLAHAQQWDTTMTEAYLLLRGFSNRLCQIHISQLDSASHHYPMSSSSVRAFSEVAWLVPDGIPFIIESRVSAAQIDEEAKKVQAVVDSVPLGAYQAIPA